MEDKIYLDTLQNDTPTIHVSSVQSLSNTGSLYVNTPNGSAVEVKRYDYETLDVQLNLPELAEFASDYGVLSTISTPTNRYNCHSYAWYTQNYNANYYWMDDPSNYYLDYSYEPAQAEENNILCYFSDEYIVLLDGTIIQHSKVNTHSAIITDIDAGFNKNNNETLDCVTVNSKWGAAGLYTHKGDDCPYVEDSMSRIDIFYTDENGNIVSTNGYLIYSFSHVEIYHPRVNHSFTLTSASNNVSIQRSIISSGPIVNQYGMYELNVTTNGKYTITIESNHGLDNKLFDANMNRRYMTVAESAANRYTYVVTLSPGRYYLRTAYADASNSGTIQIRIEPHSHIYNDWTYKDHSSHIESCCCGAQGTATASHVIRQSGIVNNRATCLDCGYLLDLRNDSYIIESPDGLRYTENGSYILPNGIVVLVDEDVDAYFAGTLIFRNRNEHIGE